MNLLWSSFKEKQELKEARQHEITVHYTWEFQDSDQLISFFRCRVPCDTASLWFISLLYCRMWCFTNVGKTSEVVAYACELEILRWKVLPIETKAAGKFWVWNMSNTGFAPVPLVCSFFARFHALPTFHTYTDIWNSHMNMHSLVIPGGFMSGERMDPASQELLQLLYEEDGVVNESVLKKLVRYWHLKIHIITMMIVLFILVLLLFTTTILIIIFSYEAFRLNRANFLIVI